MFFVSQGSLQHPLIFFPFVFWIVTDSEKRFILGIPLSRMSGTDLFEIFIESPFPIWDLYGSMESLPCLPLAFCACHVDTLCVELAQSKSAMATQLQTQAKGCIV